MRKYLFVSSLLIALLACRTSPTNDKGMRKAKGDRYYGGVFKMNEPEDFRNLYPLDVTENVSWHITSQVYEGLVKLDPKTLTPIPCIAEKWETNADATQWTFHLRKGIKFHDDACFPENKGREVTAADFKYCFDKLCEASPSNQAYALTFKSRVVGADQYYISTMDKKPLPGGVSGVKVIDPYTLQIDLNYSFAGLLNILAVPGCWVYPKEAFEKYGSEMRIKCVGTGPFIIKNIKEGDNVIMERNEAYWGVDEFGNQLPYLDGVRISFIKEKKSEMLEFKRGSLDMVFNLPVEMIPEILGELDQAKKGKNIKFDLQVAPAMSLVYFGFQHQSDLFKNKKIRQAFNYAIDRDKIVTYTLQGEGIPAVHGVVPPSFKDYDVKQVKGYNIDIEKARKLLAEAGYPNGKGFPKISLQTNSGGADRNIQIVEVLQKMLKDNLNIDVDPNVLPQGEHLETIETGKTLFWRYTWVADYPDPQIFLSIFYSPFIPKDPDERSYINSVRYSNPAFDSLYDASMREVDTKKRNELYMKADQTVMDDAAILPLYYDEYYRLLQLYVRNFDANAMEYRDLTNTYFIPPSKN